MVQPFEAEQLAASLREGAEAVLDRQSRIEPLEEVLARIVHAAVAGVTGADWAALSLVTDGRLQTHASTDPRVRALTELMHECGQGPGLDAVAAGTTVEIACPDLSAPDAPWPVFAPRAVTEHGVSAVLAYAMAPEQEPAGTITLWSRTPGEFDVAARTTAAAFAAQAAVAVYGAQRAAQLGEALATRDVIGRAKGILMERHRFSDEQAFELLVRSSQQTNIKLRDVADWLCRDVAARAEQGAQD